MKIDPSENGLSCNLTCQDFAERKDMLKREIFDFVKHSHETESGMRFEFKEKEGFDQKLMEFVAMERKCCPFFDMQLQFRSYNQGITLEIGGEDGVKAFLKTAFFS